MAFLVTPVAGYLEWWKRDEWQHFHFAHEGFFGRNTYAGGADKASHFYYGTLGEEALTAAYQKLGHSPADARLLALLNTALCAVVVEVGDALTSYGFSWEDATMTTVGALVDTLVLAKGWQDTLGFRYGPFPLRVPVGEEPEISPHRPPVAGGGTLGRVPSTTQAVIGTGYSYEVYTADVKLAGLLPRLGAKPGFARYFLVSGTYRTHGYSEELIPAQSQRLIGLEIGLSFPELARTVGVKESSWWGKSLILFLEHFRVPYSAVGIRYDLNHRRWRGLSFGDKP